MHLTMTFVDGTHLNGTILTEDRDKGRVTIAPDRRYRKQYGNRVTILTHYVRHARLV